MKLATWNMDGVSFGGSGNKWQEGVFPALFGQANVDLACLQECGALPQTKAHLATVNGMELHSYGTGSRTTRFILFYEWDQQGNRVNVAMAWKAGLTPNLETQAQNGNTGALRYAPPGIVGARPAIGIAIAGTSYYSLHAYANNNGPDAANLLDHVDNQGRPWIAAGDYNCQPDTLDGRTASQWTICPPDGPTRPSSGRRIDYAVRDAGNTCEGEVHNITGRPSDHDAVIYQF